jgi:hypothetical protein
MPTICETLWGSPVRKWFTNVAGAVAVVAGAIVAVPPAWSMLGLPEVATHWWVGSELAPMRAEQMRQRMVQNQTTVAVERSTLYQLQASLDKAKQDAVAAPSATVQERIVELAAQIEETKRRIEAAARGQGQ